jgi:2-keto-myo-inositol isomerase
MKYSGILAVNKIMQPDLPVSEFMRLAAACGASAVELRNDLSDPSIFGSESPEAINAASIETGVSVLTINALQRFNDPKLFSAKREELLALITQAEQVLCPMIVLCPVNDPEDRRSDEEQKQDLADALRNYAPLLEEHGIVGLVEPLGFPICSVRYKGQAVAAIEETGLQKLYKVVHDTFHHYLSGEQQLFPEATGLIHTSGVPAGKEKEDITDDDRVFVSDEDIMANRQQVRDMLSTGYTGPISYETFASSVQKLTPEEVETSLKASIAFLFA